MADVWISRKRWTCKYCDVTINDDLPSKRHHETGVRHKQNVQKALADLYRKGEQERKDAEHMKKEMARIEALAAESYAKDQASSDSPAASTAQLTPSAASSSSRPTSSAPKRTKQSFTHLAQQSTRPTLQSAEESPHPVAQPGEWEQVQPVSSGSTSYANETSSDRDKARSFRVREKVARLDDSDDDSSLNNIKIKKRSRNDVDAEHGPSLLQRGVKKEDPADPAEPVKEESGAASLTTDKESGTTDPTSVNEEADSGNSGGGGLFKKRRAGAGAGAKRVRAVI